MGLFSWIFLGALAGWIANGVVKSKKRSGCLFNIAVGIAGAFLGGYIFNSIGGEGITGFNLTSVFVAAIGAIIFLTVLNAIKKA